MNRLISRINKPLCNIHAHDSCVAWQGPFAPVQPCVAYLLCLEEYVGVRHQLGPLPLLRLRLAAAAAELQPVADDALAQLGQVGVAGEHSVLGLP